MEGINSSETLIMLFIYTSQNLMNNDSLKVKILTDEKIEVPKNLELKLFGHEIKTKNKEQGKDLYLNLLSFLL